jgi:enoyl-CoA hydratase
MAYENLLYEKRDGVAFITINRPKVLNALNRRTLEELDDCIRDFHADDALRAAVLTGAGEKSFVAGADINELAVLSPVNGRDYGLFGQSVLDRIERGGKPVIAAINGFALGGGCELAMACHLRLASENAARPARSEVGLIPGWRHPAPSRLVGKGRALQHVHRRPDLAEEVHRIGWSMLSSCRRAARDRGSLGQEDCRQRPLAIRFAIEGRQPRTGDDAARRVYLEATLFSLCATTEDMKEGTKAFLEKRPRSLLANDFLRAFVSLWLNRNPCQESKRRLRRRAAAGNSRQPVQQLHHRAAADRRADTLSRAGADDRRIEVVCAGLVEIP